VYSRRYAAADRTGRYGEPRGRFRPGTWLLRAGACSGRSEAGARIGKRVIPTSRQLIVDMLRGAGLEEAAASALRTLPDPVDQQDVERFGKENGLPSMGR
jgi:hypothetical protein